MKELNIGLSDLGQQTAYSLPVDDFFWSDHQVLRIGIVALRYTVIHLYPEVEQVIPRASLLSISSVYVSLSVQEVT